MNNSTFSRLHNRGYTTENMVTSVATSSIGIIGCFVAVLALGKEFFSGKSSTIVIVAALTWVDLTGILSTSFLVFHGFIVQGRWIAGFPQCQIQAFCSTACGISSGSIVTFMAVDRAVSLFKPFYYKKVASPSLARALCIATIATCFLVACLPFMGIGRYTLSRSGAYFCQFDWYSSKPKHKAFILICGCFAVTTISTMLFSNMLVFWLVWKLKRESCRIVPLDIGRRSRKKCSVAKKEEKMAKFVATVSLIFLCTWLPVTVRFFCNLYDTCLNDTADLLSMKFAIIGFVVNPFTYVIFRNIFTRTLTRNASLVKMSINHKLGTRVRRVTVAPGHSVSRLPEESSSAIGLESNLMSAMYDPR